MGDANHQAVEKVQGTQRKVYFHIVFAFLVLPFVYQVLSFLIGHAESASTYFQPLSDGKTQTIVVCVAMLALGFWWGKKGGESDTFMRRYGWFYIAIIYALAVWCLAMYASEGDFTHPEFEKIIRNGLFLFASSTWYAIDVGNYILIIFIPVSVYLLVITGCFFSSAIKSDNKKIKMKYRGRLIILLTATALVSVLMWQLHQRYQWVLSPLERNMEALREEANQQEAKPLAAEGVPALQTVTEFTMSESYPRIDGIEQLQPLYVPAVERIYQFPQTKPKETYLQNILSNSFGLESLQRLGEGKTDLVFEMHLPKQPYGAAFDYSQSVVGERTQKNHTEVVVGLTKNEAGQYAPADWVSRPEKELVQAMLNNPNQFAFTFVLVAKEALVFTVNSANPVEGLSLEQVKNIYSGEINNWGTVGGENKTIYPYQRPDESKAQQLIKGAVMQGAEMRSPLQEEKLDEKRSMTLSVADYRNTPGAIGYLLHHNVAAELKSGEIKPLSIDGVEPTAENIRSGKYPLVAHIYMLTYSPTKTAHTQQLVDWFMSEQGQQRVKEAGYIPVSK